MFITCTGLASNVCSSDDSRRTPGGKLYPDFSGMFLSDRMAFQFRWVIDGVIAFEDDVAIALQFGTTSFILVRCSNPKVILLRSDFMSDVRILERIWLSSSGVRVSSI